MPILSIYQRKKHAILRNIQGTPTDYDPDVAAWLDAIAAAGGSVSTGQADAVNAYWLEMKAEGLDLLSIADYPMVGDKIAMEHNLKTPGSFRLDFVGDNPEDFTAQGWQPNGASYALTGIDPPTDLALNDVALEYYSRTDIAAAQAEFGAGINPQTIALWLRENTTQNTLWDCYNVTGNRTSGVTLDSLGQFIASRQSDVLSNVFKNGLQSGESIGLSSDQVPIEELTIGAINTPTGPATFTARQCAGAGVYAGLSSDQALHFYLAREAMNLRLGRSVSDAGRVLLEYIENVERVGGSLTDTEIRAVQAYLLELSEADILEGYLIADYPMLGGSEASNSISLFNNEDFNLEFFGGWVHSPTGALPDGSTAYANTKLVPFITLPLGSAMAEYYSRTDLPGNNSDVVLGAQSNGNSNRIGMFLLRENLTGRLDMWNTGEGRIDAATATSDGDFSISRIALDDLKVYKNGVLLDESLGSSIGVQPNIPIYIGARNNNGTAENFSNMECAGASIGLGFTEAQVLAHADARALMNQIAGRAV